MNIPTREITVQSRVSELVTFLVCFLFAPASGLVLMYLGGIRSDHFLGLPQPARKFSGVVYGAIITAAGTFFYSNFWVGRIDYLGSQEALMLVVATWLATDFFARELR